MDIFVLGLGTASDELELRAKEMAMNMEFVLHQHEAYEPKSTNHETSRLGKTEFHILLKKVFWTKILLWSHEHTY
ncbi:MAG: hypothetical protein CM1200mP1_15060 [Candidatus Neomarinimicrobiota bacterium]|nr:MAG: hypothetical protein CM1200mP1_15060 [Candidatus Neomarinimicrobiota bacterium]